MTSSFATNLVFWIQNEVKRNYLAKNAARLKNRDFTIISNNCWGGILYTDLGLPYQTPFVNMFIHTPCYLKLLSDLEYYINMPLAFKAESKYLLKGTLKYPIATLDDIEIHFIHYKSDEEVASKWNQRLGRINLNNLVVVMSERDLCAPEHVYQFDSLNFENKICFTVNSYNLRSAVRLKSLALLKEILPADQIAGLTYSKINIIDYLNHVKR